MHIIDLGKHDIQILLQVVPFGGFFIGFVRHLGEDETRLRRWGWIALLLGSQWDKGLTLLCALVLELLSRSGSAQIRRRTP